MASLWALLEISSVMYFYFLLPATMTAFMCTGVTSGQKMVQMAQVTLHKQQKEAGCSKVEVWLQSLVSFFVVHRLGNTYIICITVPV